MDATRALDQGAIDLMARYPKAIAHLWRQNHEQRLSLMFGAGASRDLGVPTWPDLIHRIADDPEVQGVGLVGAGVGDPLPTAAQVLYHHFRANNYDNVLREVHSADLADRVVHGRWRRIVHRALYSDVPSKSEELLERDTVYRHFLDVIVSSPLTVNYNFDDSIERLLQARGAPAEIDREGLGGRNFESLVDPRLVFRRSSGNILHVNGYLPENVLETVEGPLVLNEISFADQLIDSIGGAYSTLLHFLTKHTFLLVGLSLEDETLRHLLRQNSLLNPGHYHYRVHHVGQAETPLGGDALTSSYFETFNLITLYLTSNEIAALGRLMSANFDVITHAAKAAGITTFFTYYLAGVPGAGKTTTFRHFSGLIAFDEWFEPRLSTLSKPFISLSSSEREQIDAWILRQISLKNHALRKQENDPGIGLNVIDRCPPDAIAFTDPAGWAAKAGTILEAVANRNERATIVPGTVILLVGEPRELMYRAKARDRQTTSTEDFMEWQQNALRHIYTGASPGRTVQGAITVDTRGLSVRSVVQRVAKIIYLDDYRPQDLQGRVRRFEKGTLRLPAKFQTSRARVVRAPRRSVTE